MTRALAFWVLMLIWLVDGVVWHLGVFPLAAWGLTLVPFILLILLGWQVFGAPIK